MGMMLVSPVAIACVVFVFFVLVGLTIFFALLTVQEPFEPWNKIDEPPNNARDVLVWDGEFVYVAQYDGHWTHDDTHVMNGMQPYRAWREIPYPPTLAGRIAEMEGRNLK